MRGCAHEMIVLGSRVNDSIREAGGILMTAETDMTTGKAESGADGALDALSLIAKDQRRINILLTRIVHDHDKRLKGIEDRGVDSLASEPSTPKPQLVIGKDVPAYPLSDLDFLKKSFVFNRLSDDGLRIVYSKGEIRKIPKGGALFEIGSKADTVYVVKTGVVEIARPVDDPNDMKTVAYFTTSDAIGEMRIITQSPHRSMARAPGGAEVFALERDALIELIGLVPEIAVHFIEMYAHKLEGTVSTLRTHEQKQRQLEGNLQYFDLATVIQTLLSTDQRTGVLQVNDDKQQTIAELFVDEGTVKRARMGKLSGEEAFYQLFQAELTRGTFFFKEDIEVEEEEAEMELPGMSLLMEAARLQDELADIRASIVTDPSKVYAQKTGELEWDDTESTDEDRILAETIWRAIGKGMSVEQLVDEMPRSEYAVYRVIATLIETGQIE